MPKEIDHGQHDDEQTLNKVDEAEQALNKVEKLETTLAPEPQLLPAPRYLKPGQFGPGSVKGGRIKNLRRKNETALLKACSVSANISTACKKAGISLSHVSRVLATNPALRQRVREHLELAIDGLEHSALRRARWGWKRKKTVIGPEGPEEVEEHMPPSDRLAVKILEARRPESYGKRAEPGSVHVGNVTVLSRDQLTTRAAKVLSSKPADKIPNKSDT